MPRLSLKILLTFRFERRGYFLLSFAPEKRFKKRGSRIGWVGKEWNKKKYEQEELGDGIWEKIEPQALNSGQGRANFYFSPHFLFYLLLKLRDWIRRRAKYKETKKWLSTKTRDKVWTVGKDNAWRHLCNQGFIKCILVLCLPTPYS